MNSFRPVWKKIFTYPNHSLDLLYDSVCYQCKSDYIVHVCQYMCMVEYVGQPNMSLMPMAMRSNVASNGIFT